MWIGLDFGTTNSGAAVYDGQLVRPFALDPTSTDPTVIRSALYITRDHQVYIGQEAINTYYRQNIGRPSKLVRQYVAEIETTMGDVGSVKGYPVGPSTFVRDVYVMVDEFTPGRLLRSLKSGLTAGHEETMIFGRPYALEELIALYLRQIRERVEAQTDQPVTGVVLGRPVNFYGAEGEKDNRWAVDRLRHAAEEAGFRQVSFELEPVAAALHYERGIQKPEHVVVFDLGGGTLDITVMRLGEPGRQEVYATGGAGVAGDLFDQRIVEGLLLEHFGRGSTWGEDGAPFPSQYTDALVQWQTIPELSRPETLGFLQLAQLTGSHPARVRALQWLLVDNHVVRLIDEVEGAKVALSTARFAAVRLEGDDIDLWQPITRTQFEMLIADLIGRVETCLLDTIARSGLRVEEIDAVVRTGGSAQIPRFVELLGRIFGPAQVVLSNVFGGVTAGLAIRAHASQI